METLLLLDGNALAYRAHFAVRGLATADGRPTNAVFGFHGILNRLVREHRPERIACAFDAPGPTFRHKLFPAYKENRPGMPDELAAQLPLIDDLLQACRVAIVRHEGLEADDLLAALALRAREAGAAVRLVSPDKDLLQLVSTEIRVVHPQTGETLGPEQVRARFGVPPDLVADLLALAGDSSDNIPGVPGVGGRSAAALLDRFGSLEGIYEHLEAVRPPALREKLAAGAAAARLGRRLAALDDKAAGAALPGWDEMKRRPPDTRRLRKLFRRLEFHRLLEKLERPDDGPVQQTLFGPGGPAEKTGDAEPEPSS